MGYFRKAGRGQQSLGDFATDTCSNPDEQGTGYCRTMFPPDGVPPGSSSGIAINNPDDANMNLPTSGSSTTQDTTVLPGGATVGGQATGTPIASVSNWKTVSGVCYATNTDFLSQMKELQRQCNRVAQVKGIALISIDGQIGPATLALMGKIAALGAYSSISNSSIVTCDNVCSNLYSFIAATKMFADSLGASSSVSSPTPSGTPQMYSSAAGGLVSQPVSASLADAFNNLSTTEKLLAAGGAVGLIYFLRKTPKKGRK